jgi:hypothetical protein
VTDQINDWGLRYQPFLYELPQAIVKVPAGTVLLAGNKLKSIYMQVQTKGNLFIIMLFVGLLGTRSEKPGSSSHIAHGGRAIPNSEKISVWEPFIMM